MFFRLTERTLCRIPRQPRSLFCNRLSCNISSFQRYYSQDHSKQHEEEQQKLGKGNSWITRAVGALFIGGTVWYAYDTIERNKVPTDRVAGRHTNL